VTGISVGVQSGAGSVCQHSHCSFFESLYCSPAGICYHEAMKKGKVQADTAIGKSAGRTVCRSGYRMSHANTQGFPLVPLVVCLVLSFAACTSSPPAMLTLTEGDGLATEDTRIARLPDVVRDFLETNGWNLDSYADSNLSDLSIYQSHVRRYAGNTDTLRIWEHYRSTKPDEAWDTGMTRLGVAWDPSVQRLYMSEDEELGAFLEGQVYVLELRLLGFYRLPVAFRIARLDQSSRIIEFVYLRVNKSNGLQRIVFISGPDGRNGPTTIIEHSSWFRSGNPGRDSFLYRPFHEAFIDAFHRSLARSGGYALRVIR
jgi:hypothetical protein